jgi:spoIIIJ-associated protein
MAPWIEFEGRNIDAAVENACQKLGKSKSELKYDVVTYGSTGIFGLVGVKKAKIRVRRPLEEKVVKAQEKPVEILDPEPSPLSLEADPMDIDQPAEQHVSEAIEKPQRVEPDSLNMAKNILQKMVDLITVDASVSVEEREPQSLFFDIKGGNSAMLIGKRGQTLEAIQYLIEKVMNTHGNERIRVYVDVEGYLNNKTESMQRLAKRLSQKAKKSGKPVTIGQLNSQDRRIIHMVLKEDHGVRTQSVGDGVYRKLVIFPKKVNEKHNKKDAPKN